MAWHASRTSRTHAASALVGDPAGWDTATDVHFAIKGDIEKLCKGVNDLSTDAFLWETFTTKPYHDLGRCEGRTKRRQWWRRS